MAAPTMDNKTVNTNGTENMFKNMNDNVRTAFDNGVKFQQETLKSVTSMFNCCEGTEDARGKFETIANDTINMVRKNAEQTQKNFDETCKNGMNMIKKSCETMKADKDLFAQTRDMWSTMFDMMKTNVDMFTKTTTATIENVSEFVSKTIETGAKKTK